MCSIQRKISFHRLTAKYSVEWRKGEKPHEERTERFYKGKYGWEHHGDGDAHDVGAIDQSAVQCRRPRLYWAYPRCRNVGTDGIGPDVSDH